MFPLIMRDKCTMIFVVLFTNSTIIWTNNIRYWLYRFVFRGRRYISPHCPTHKTTQACAQNLFTRTTFFFSFLKRTPASPYILYTPYHFKTYPHFAL